MQPRFISNARTLTAILLTLLGPNSAVISTIKDPCSAVRDIVKVANSTPNGLGGHNIQCGRIPLGKGTCSLSTVTTTISRGMGLIRVRQSHNCVLHSSLFPRSVGGVISAIGTGGPSAVYFMSGYCNRFAYGRRPVRLNTSVATNSLVGGTNNKFTPAKTCVYNGTSLIRLYTRT